MTIERAKGFRVTRVKVCTDTFLLFFFSFYFLSSCKQAHIARRSPVRKSKRPVHLWEITNPSSSVSVSYSTQSHLLADAFRMFTCCGLGLSPAEKNKALNCSSKIERFTVSLYFSVPHTALAIIAAQKNEAQSWSLFTYYRCLYHQCWCSRTEIQAVSDRSTWKELTNPFAGWKDREHTR